MYRQMVNSGIKDVIVGQHLATVHLLLGLDHGRSRIGPIGGNGAFTTGR